MNKKSAFLVESALIAALYAGLTFISNIFGLAYGPIQFRLSEALTILPIFTFSAIPGLAIGCFMANILSFSGIIDMIFGTVATLIASALSYYLRNFLFTKKKIPLLSILPPIIINSIVIGLEISLFYVEPNKSSFVWGFFASFFSVFLGETVVCLLLGIPLYFIVKKYKLFKS